MKKAKDLISLRLRCLLNGDFTFNETVEDLYQDLKDSKTFNQHSFSWGFFVGAFIILIIFSYTQHK